MITTVGMQVCAWFMAISILLDVQIQVLRWLEEIFKNMEDASRHQGTDDIKIIIDLTDVFELYE